jgi:hypothetical protein
MIYRVVTYDKTTERMKGTFAIPSSLIQEVKSIAGFKPHDDGLGEYLLDQDQTVQVARVLGFSPEMDKFFYYVEPYDPPEADGLRAVLSRADTNLPGNHLRPSDDAQPSNRIQTRSAGKAP